MSQSFAAEDDVGSTPSTPHLPDTLESVSALARFEFESGKSNDGTKVLMVEWEDHSNSRDVDGVWQVSWAGKTTVLPADERTSENTRRFYFLLPPGTTIPPYVKLTYQPRSVSFDTVQKPQHSRINVLPAIFPPELGVTARTSGRKGVLHTIWAKKRMQVLEKEIRQEQKVNPEGIALEMAMSEREWIGGHFGIAPKVPSLDTSASIPRSPSGPASPSLTSPMSPGGRRLGEKLKGLSLGTSERDLAERREGVNTPTSDLHPLSPEGADVAVSSFSSFRQRPSTSHTSASQKKQTTRVPPEHVKRQQSAAPIPSMNRIASLQEREGGDELFAKAMSPRTPDVTRSPFSFSSKETLPYLKARKGNRE